MDHKQGRQAIRHEAYCMPALLAVLDALDKFDAMRIGEYAHGGLKRDAVFPYVGLIFVFIPFELAASDQNYSVSQILVSAKRNLTARLFPAVRLRYAMGPEFADRLQM
jgi:hypothetical protein